MPIAIGEPGGGEDSLLDAGGAPIDGLYAAGDDVANLTVGVYPGARRDAWPGDDRRYFVPRVGMSMKRASTIAPATATT